MLVIIAAVAGRRGILPVRAHLLCGGAVMPPESVEGLFQKARQAVEQRTPEKGRQLYVQALGLKGDSPDVHYGLATVCFQLKDLPSAAHHFKEVTRLDPLRAGAYINLGAIYNLLDQLDDAVPALRRAIQLDSHPAGGYYNLALGYRRKSQNDLAGPAHPAAPPGHPPLADAHYNLANILLEKQQFNMAYAHYKQALELRPNWDKAANGLAQVEAALSALEQEQQSAPPAAAPTENGAEGAVSGPQVDPGRMV